MPITSWSDELSVGDDQADHQHRVLMEHLNELDAALAAGHSPDTCGQILERLLSHTQEHFAYEERCMVASGYSQLEEHQREHRDLLGQLENLSHDHKHGRVLFSRAMMDFLILWLMIHMKDSDQRFASACNNGETI